jgi:transposase
MAICRKETTAMRSVAQKRRGVKVVRLESGERIYVGVDVHKRTYHVAIWSDRRGLLAYWVQPAKAELLVEKLVPYRERLVRVVYEAGPTGYGLVRALRAARIKADVIAPGKVPRPAVAGNKSDRVDCRKLAEEAPKLEAICVPDEEEEADRQVVRLRWRMVEKCRAVKQQIKGFLLQHGVAEPAGLSCWAKRAVAELRGLQLRGELSFALKILLDELEHAQSQVERVTEKLKELEGAERHRADVAVLESAPGVGLITAMTFKTELVSPERFEDPREVSAIQGLAPWVEESGESRWEGPLLKGGNRYLRTVLVEAAWRWVKQDPAAAKKYRKLLSNTGNSNKAIVGMARKLGIILWRMLTRGEKYRGLETKQPRRAS